MTEPKSFRDGKQFAWDSTSLTLAETCLRKYQYKIIDGWQPRSQSVHLRFGGAYATALEHYHKILAGGSMPEEALIDVVLEALTSTWDYVVDEAGVVVGGSPWISDHNTKTRENLIRSIIWYLDHWVDDPAKVLILSDGRPAVEHTFALPIDDGFLLCGHLDRVVEFVGSPYIMDQKTTGTTISASYFDQYKPDIQMSAYTFAGKAIFNIPIKGVIIDAAQIAVGFTRFERGMTHRTDPELNEWYDGSMDTIHRARDASDLNYFPMNRTACGNYGGCEFRRVCSKSPDVRKQFLAADFVQGPRWDPLERR